MKRFFTLSLSGIISVLSCLAQPAVYDPNHFVPDCMVTFDVAVMESFPPQYRFIPSRSDSFAKFFWDFGDGNVSYQASPVHTYQKSGEYMVCLTYTSPDDRCVSQFCDTLVVTGYFTDCNYTGTVKDYTGLDGCGLVIELDNGAVLEPAEITPNFVLRDGQRVKLGYTELTDRASICMAGIITRIDCIEEINDTCFVSFYYHELPWFSIIPPVYQFVIDSGLTFTEVIWDFGDGTVTNEYSPTHSFRNDGYYNVCVKAVSLEGCTASYCLTGWFEGSDPQPGLCENFIRITTDFILNGQECNGTASAGLVDKSGNPVPASAYYWSTGETSTQVYNLCPGYNYSVTVVDVTGCAVSGSFAYGSPLIYPDSIIGYWNYEQDDMDFVFNLPVYSDSVYCEWDFGDGSSASGSIVNHTYSSEDNYTVQLKVYDNLGNMLYSGQIPVSTGLLSRIKENEPDQPVVYPVPAGDLLFVEITGSDRINRVEIVNAEGRLLNVNSSVNQAGNKAEINVSGVSSGFYIGKLTISNGEIKTFRFIKE